MEEEVTALRRENVSLQEQLSDLTAQVMSLKKENSRLRKMAVEEIPSLVGAVKTLISERDSAQQHESTPSKSAALRNNVNVTDHSLVTAVHPRTPDSMSEDFTLAALRGKQTNTPASVPLGTDGDVMVSAHCWETARAQPTAKGMARTLLLGLFSVEVLLRSNLTGGVNKVEPSAERRQALDPQKLKALLDAVIQHHPAAKVADIRTNINKKICELRHQEKKKTMDSSSLSF
ncbi:uncharacterized protein LOC112143471 [Oryzias melastigma]|uniref:uncharacterized protein LOC112143471 n=1 Tax=Oryzias melastigma TaxID=30732 RepID=UPI00168D6C62|nr:uncharacterized protein LOC112143471 [Oryzias melastigma]